MKNSKVKEYYNSLPILNGVKFPSQVTFAIVKSMEDIHDANELIEKTKTRIGETLSMGEDGKVKIKKHESGKDVYDCDVNEFNKQWNDLMNEETPVELTKFDRSLVEKVDISIEQAFVLKDFFL